MEFKDRLAELFKVLNTSQTKLAKATGVGRSSFSLYLSGKKTPTITVAIKVAIVTNVSLNWLLLGKGPMFRDELAPKNEEVRMRSPSYGPPSPKDNIKKWLDVFWEQADPDERIWLMVELKKRFPEFAEWLKKEKINV